jgi:hypothetical protein
VNNAVPLNSRGAASQGTRPIGTTLLSGPGQKDRTGVFSPHDVTDAPPASIPKQCDPRSGFAVLPVVHAIFDYFFRFISVTSLVKPPQAARARADIE